jgi:hypothetical protein
MESVGWPQDSFPVTLFRPLSPAPACSVSPFWAVRSHSHRRPRCASSADVNDRPWPGKVLRFRLRVVALRATSCDSATSSRFDLQLSASNPARSLCPLTAWGDSDSPAFPIAGTCFASARSAIPRSPTQSRLAPTGSWSWPCSQSDPATSQSPAHHPLRPRAGHLWTLSLTGDLQCARFARSCLVRPQASWGVPWPHQGWMSDRYDGPQVRTHPPPPRDLQSRGAGLEPCGLASLDRCEGFRRAVPSGATARARVRHPGRVHCPSHALRRHVSGRPGPGRTHSVADRLRSVLPRLQPGELDGQAARRSHARSEPRRERGIIARRCTPGFNAVLHPSSVRPHRANDRETEATDAAT